MIVGLLAMLFIIVSTYIVMARFDRQTNSLVARGVQVTQIVDSLHRVATDALRRNISGNTDKGMSYVEIPGYGASDPNGSWGGLFLASSEPVWDPNSPRDFPSATPADYLYPALSSFVGRSTGARRLSQLMIDADGPRGGALGVDPNLSSADMLAYVRQPINDATGDGVPDSSFIATAPLTELANAMAGRLVRVGGVNPSRLNSDPTPPDPNDYYNYLRWQQFDEQAQYSVAMRVVSHGGMVQISAPTTDVQWNSEFLQGMFYWVKNPNDAGFLNPSLTAHGNVLYELGASTGAVEPVLRRRGGLLAGGSDGQISAWPVALWHFGQLGFGETLVRQFAQVKKAENWQRYNLVTEWGAWRDAATVDPNQFNRYWFTGSGNPLWAPAARQWLTTVNNSDELARIQRADALTANSGLGLRPGQLKYYLGRITDQTRAPNGVPYGAFRQVTAGGPWVFNDKTWVDPNHPTPQGFMVVRELADYFAELLAGYEGWQGGTNVTEAGRRREQAMMLAVNTVAFAAPRDPNGIDSVYYADHTGAAGSLQWKTYIGYTPQPFITQVIAYNKPGVMDPNDPNKPPTPFDPNNPPSDPNWILPALAVAVQLYNPNDSLAPGVVGPTHDLNLARFAISLNDQYAPSGDVSTLPDPNALIRLDRVQPRLPGRTAIAFTIHADGGNDALDAAVQPTLYIPHSVPHPDPNDNVLRVKLWALPLQSDVGPYLVDEQDLDLTQGTSTPGASDVWFANSKRDRGYEPYLGRWTATSVPPSDGYSDGYARWRIVLPDDPNSISIASNDPNGPDQTALDELRAAFPVFPADPCDPHTRVSVPLYTMNARLDAVPTIHGAARPPSFPTVGFMLFVPRFSHMMQVNGAAITPRPMNWWLAQQWEKRTVAGGGAGALTAPADFGHMPIFDNAQDPNATGAFASSKLGCVPWGLLVFDYFTTLNPSDAGPDGTVGTPDDIDPYRVPGRINVNTAPWYVLAGLPVLGPVSLSDPNFAALPRTNPPAFWSGASGVLTGFEADRPTTPRFSGFTTLVGARPFPAYDAVMGWWRLGPHLAQASAAYRDRLQYSQYESNAAPFGDAQWRNNTVAPSGSYRATQYDPIRGEADVWNPNDPLYDPNAPKLKRGFLSLGELANVVGFDSSVLNPSVTGTTVYKDDFMKAVSLLALLDTHFLTTRSNTFTIYAALMDREDPQASMRSQVTVDRSNLLPRLIWEDRSGNGIRDPEPTDHYTVLQNSGEPEIIGEREVSYYNARYDD